MSFWPAPLLPFDLAVVPGLRALALPRLSVADLADKAATAIRSIGRSFIVCRRRIGGGRPSVKTRVRVKGWG